MKALLIKEILVQKFNVILGAFYSLILFLLLGLARDIEDPGFIYALSGIAVGAMITLGSVGGDRGNTHRFTLSLPITRAQVVNGKFLLTFLSTAYGIACAAAIGGLLSIPAIGFVSRGVNGLDLLRVAAGMLLVTAMMPFYFRFGHMMIRYFLFALIGLGIILQVIGVVVLSLSRNRSGGIIFFDWLFGMFRDNDPIRTNLILVAVGAGVCLIAYLVSMLIYTRRDL